VPRRDQVDQLARLEQWVVDRFRRSPACELVHREPADWWPPAADDEWSEPPVVPVDPDELSR
jgi:hypothetical protein